MKHGKCIFVPHDVYSRMRTTNLNLIMQKSSRVVQMIIAHKSFNIIYYTPNGYIVPMEFRVHFFPLICAFSRRTKMHLNGMFLIWTDFFKIIVPL